MSTIDPRIPRTWFFSTGDWSAQSEKSKSRYQGIQTKATQDRQGDFVARIFLVRAPLTFGHSQLVLELSGEDLPDEAQQFLQASPIIENALSAFKTAFKDNDIHTKSAFEDLAKLTLTRGTYVKTLILRASAEEKNEATQVQYKVHLIPYFESHASRCHQRYSTIHNLDPSEKGGLLGWLGERETEVDKWQVGTQPFAYKLDQIVNEDLKMPALAKALCEAY